MLGSSSRGSFKVALFNFFLHYVCVIFFISLESGFPELPGQVHVAAVLQAGAAATAGCRADVPGRRGAQDPEQQPAAAAAWLLDQPDFQGRHGGCRPHAVRPRRCRHRRQPTQVPGAAGCDCGSRGCRPPAPPTAATAPVPAAGVYGRPDGRWPRLPPPAVRDHDGRRGPFCHVQELHRRVRHVLRHAAAAAAPSVPRNSSSQKVNAFHLIHSSISFNIFSLSQIHV